MLEQEIDEQLSSTRHVAEYSRSGMLLLQG